ncbi:MAG: efflux RND transporter periplasmic adaptor subunit, partial [Verrucomicrobiota bacterium]
NALERSEKNLRLLEDRLSKTVIRAPFDCTVLTRPVSIGQAVSGSGGFNSGTEVLTIADLSKMIINAHVNQADVTRLAAGQEVDIQVDSVPGLRLKGTVERIAPQSTIKNNVKGYAARILLSHVDERVRPGMTANVSIPVASAENVVAVPLAAIFTEQGERFAFVLQENGAFEKRNVQIGLADYDVAEVQSGLSVGDVVALVPPEGVSFNAAALARPPGATQARAGAANPAASGASSTTGGSATPRPASPTGNRPGGTATSRPQSSVTR